MKLGYSILLGETIDAVAVQYKDCERFQIVCPQCKEPIFKVRRGADSPDENHYLAHYAAAAAYQGQCELRVGKMVRSELEKGNRTSRDQRLAFFLSVLRRTIGMSPLYSTTAEKTHWKMDNAPAIPLLRGLVWEQTILPNREFIFDESAEDYLWNLDHVGWALATSFSLDRQRQIARDMWLTITTPAGRANYNFLWNHAFLREMNTIMASMDGANTELEARVMRTQAAYMSGLLECKKAEINNLLSEMAHTHLPASFNKIKGVDTIGDRSTYFTRMLGNITIGTVATLIELPYFELLKQQFGDPGKVYPYQPGIEPVDAEEIERMKRWQERHRPSMGGH
jgi:hypothetical protein